METNESISTQNIASTNVTAVQNANDYFDQLACSVSPVVTRTLKMGVDAIFTIASFAFQAGIGAASVGFLVSLIGGSGMATAGTGSVILGTALAGSVLRQTAETGYYLAQTTLAITLYVQDGGFYHCAVSPRTLSKINQEINPFSLEYVERIS